MMSGAKKRVPKRRFKEFLNAGDWEQRKLSDISTKVTTKNVDIHYTETLTNSAEQGIISQVDFFDKEISNKDNINGYYIVENNDFIYNPRISTLAPVGPINRNKLNRTGIMSPLYTVFRASTVDLDFLEWYFQSSHWHRYMKLNGDSGARSDRIAIKDSTFFDMPIKTPVNIKEQVLIGETLEKFNQFIILHQRKLDKLQATKKALLQEMFPEEGQDKPKRRFKGFTDSWEQRKLGDFTNQINTFVNPEDAKLPLWSLTAEAGLIEKSDRYERDFLVKKKDQFKRIETNTLVYNPMNIIIGSIDIYTGLYPIAVSGYYVSIVYDKNIDTDFLKEVLLLPSSLKMYKNYATGSLIERQRVQYPTFSKLQLLLPNLDEQKAIGQLFKSLNLNITLHQRKLDKLKNLKQAYLNEMFV